MHVTMKDIAEDLGVSVNTVSKVLRDHPDIPAKTKARVRKKMEELNYRPNLAARALVTGRTKTVGLVVPDLVNPFFGEVVRGLSRVLNAKGYSLIIASSEEDRELEVREIDQLLARRVDALLLVSSRASSEPLGRMERQKTPVVLIDRKPENAKVNFVGVNDEEIGMLATEHLASIGRQRIAYIGGRSISTAMGRLQGYRKALRKHGMKADARYAIGRERFDVGSDEAGYEAMKTLLELEPRPDAVFCYNDPTAMGAIRAVLESELDVPRDVAVVGAGNLPYTGFWRIPLTTIDQQSQAIGDLAGKMALELIESGRAVKDKSVVLKPRLVIRESTRS